MQRWLPFLILGALAAAFGCARRDTLGQPTSPTASKEPAQVVVAAAPAPAASSGPVVVSGTVKAEAVIDGDTIALQGRRIRLYGIDAPELHQVCEVNAKQVPCGAIARNALIGFTMETTVRCERQDIDRYGRDVSRCLADGYDVSAGLVRAGLAVAYRQYSTAYVHQETEAQQYKHGMWKGTFVMPWDWRRLHR